MKRIMFAGASGVGKTTCAKWVSDNLTLKNEPIIFKSGSMSDLVPETKDMTHRDMLERDTNKLKYEDFQVMNLRHKLVKEANEKGEHLVVDRSYLDSAAYYMYKQMDKTAGCEIENFLKLCKQLTTTDCTHLILVDFSTDMLKEWVTEDNNKRITNNYFQMSITYLMKMIVDIWGLNKLRDVSFIKKDVKSMFSSNLKLNYGATIGEINSVYGTTKVMLLKEIDKTIREKLITSFIDDTIYKTSSPSIF